MMVVTGRMTTEDFRQATKIANELYDFLVLQGHEFEHVSIETEEQLIQEMNAMEIYRREAKYYGCNNDAVEIALAAEKLERIQFEAYMR